MKLALAYNENKIKNLVVAPDNDLKNGLPIAEGDVEAILNLYKGDCFTKTYSKGEESSVYTIYTLYPIDVVKSFGCSLGYFDEDDNFVASLSLKITLGTKNTNQLSLNTDLVTELCLTGKASSMKASWARIKSLECFDVHPEKSFSINNDVFVY